METTNSNLRVIIVDDEIAAIDVLKYKLLKYNPQIEILAHCDNADEACEAIEILKPNLVFLDIEMPNFSGFDVLANIENPTFEVIFSTAHEQYTIDAIRADAFDYLLKPISEDDLARALGKLEKKIKDKAENKSSEIIASPDFFNFLKPLKVQKRLQVVTAECTHFIPYEDIIRIDADGSCSHIHILNRKRIISGKPLCEYDFLDKGDNEFMKVHRSHIINLNVVSRYIRGDGGIAIMNDHSEIDIARRKKDEFLNRLSER